MIDRLDRIAAELTRRAAGVEVSRTDATRAVIARGLTHMERELGIAVEASPKASAPPARKGGTTSRKPAK